jgi:hypothetical protein
MKILEMETLGYVANYAQVESQGITYYLSLSVQIANRWNGLAFVSESQTGFWGWVPARFDSEDPEYIQFADEIANYLLHN